MSRSLRKGPFVEDTLLKKIQKVNLQPVFDYIFLAKFN
jgi:ribosomal protein S19